MLMRMLGKMPFRLSWKASEMELERHYSQYPLLRKHYKHRIKSRLFLFFRAFYPRSSLEGKILHLTSCSKMVFPSTFDIMLSKIYFQ